MALVRFGNGVSEIVGSIAGNVYARNRGGAYIRNRTKPINAPTVPQSTIRQRFAGTMASFAALTSGAIQAWNVLAESTTRKNKLGEDYTPTGVQMFMELNLNLQAAGQPIIEEAPVAEPDTAPAIDVTTLAVVAEETGNALTTFTVSADLMTGAGNVIIESSLPFQQRQSSTSVKYRSIGSIAATGAPVSVLTGFTDAYGSINVPDGASLWLRLRAVDANGFAGPWLYQVISVTAAV